MADFLYTDAESVKSELELGSGQSFTDELDGLLISMIEQSSRLIDRFKSVEPGAYKTADIESNETRYYFGSGIEIQMIDYIPSIATVSVEETDGTFTAWTIDVDFYTIPYNAALIGEPIRRLETTRKTGSTKSVWPYGPKRIEVRGKFGIAVNPPADIERAALIQTQRFYQRALQGFRDTGAITEIGQLTYTKQLDPDVKNILTSAFPRVSRVAV